VSLFLKLIASRLFKNYKNELTKEAGKAISPKLKILLINFPKSFSIIVYTIFPLTEAKYILRKVLRIKKTVRRKISKSYYDFHVGITILTSFFILEKKTESTFPLPFFLSLSNNLILISSVEFFLFRTCMRKKIMSIIVEEISCFLRDPIKRSINIVFMLTEAYLDWTAIIYIRHT